VTDISSLIDPAPVFRVGADEVALLRDGAEAFPAMLDAIAGAQREILLEMYWIGDDICGRKFLDAIALRAKDGVRVRVVYDAVGSIGLPDGFFAPLVLHGGEVLEWHALSPIRTAFSLDNLETRDHRKLLVVDGRVAFTGGINLAAQWMAQSEGGGGWRDDVIMVRGPCAGELRSLFYDTWKKKPFAIIPSDVRPLPKRRSRPVWVLANLFRRRRNIRREYLVRIANAKKSVDVANSYFIPNRSVRGALFRAAARGVRVRVLVPSQSDVPIVQQAVEALFEMLLTNGVEIYAMNSRILHAKTAIIDEQFTMIGSYNLDSRSWLKNLEANVAVEDEAFARYVRSWFERDCELGMRVDLETWRRRPVTKRILEWSSFALRRLW
jgi:cardiolipin synthase